MKTLPLSRFAINFWKRDRGRKHTWQRADPFDGGPLRKAEKEKGGEEKKKKGKRVAYHVWEKNGPVGRAKEPKVSV